MKNNSKAAGKVALLPGPLLRLMLYNVFFHQIKTALSPIRIPNLGIPQILIQAQRIWILAKNIQSDCRNVPIFQHIFDETHRPPSNALVLIKRIYTKPVNYIIFPVWIQPFSIVVCPVALPVQYE